MNPLLLYYMLCWVYSQVKCSQYWPSPAVGTITCGDMEIKLDNVVELRDYTIRNFTLTHVRQYPCPHLSHHKWLTVVGHKEYCTPECVTVCAVMLLVATYPSHPT